MWISKLSNFLFIFYKVFYLSICFELILFIDNEITTEAHSQRIQAVLDSFSPCGSSPNIQNRGQHPHDKQLIERGKQTVRKANRRKEEDEEIEKRINKTFSEPTGPLTACGIKINEKLVAF